MEAYFDALLLRRSRVIASPSAGNAADKANGSGAVEAPANGQNSGANDPHDLDQAIRRVWEAAREFMNGSSTSWKAICSHRPDATLFGGWGAHERGWEELGPRYDWAAARFVEGEVTFQELARHVAPNLCCTIHLEQATVRLQGVAEPAAMTLRVTHVLRREETGWKLVHRHADHITAIQPTEFVIGR